MVRSMAEMPMDLSSALGMGSARRGPLGAWVGLLASHPPGSGDNAGFVAGASLTEGVPPLTRGWVVLVQVELVGANIRRPYACGANALAFYLFFMNCLLG